MTLKQVLIIVLLNFILLLKCARLLVAIKRKKTPISLHSFRLMSHWVRPIHFRYEKIIFLSKSKFKPMVICWCHYKWPKANDSPKTQARRVLPL